MDQMLEVDSSKVVIHGNKVFAALDGASPQGLDTGCQDQYLAIPAGWMVAEYDADSAHVIAANPWSTHIMVLRDGEGFWTNQGTSYGTAAGNLGCRDCLKS